MDGKLGRVGVIGRFKPLHHGGAALLESLCEKAEHVVIGIGSANKYNIRNPFTADETEGLLNAFLKDRFNNYEIIKVPDFAHLPGNENGLAWKEYVCNAYGKLDAFVSGNEFVSELLKSSYKIIYPWDIVPKEKHVLLRATRVRYEIARYGDWEKLVPEKVAEFMKEKKLDERFRKEFGLMTLACVAEGDYNKNESALQEKLHARER